MKRYSFLLIALCTFLSTSCIAQVISLRPEKVTIAGDLVNNSSHVYGSSYAVYSTHGEKDVQTNIDPTVTPTKGRFVIEAAVGFTYEVNVDEMMTYPNHITICKLLVKANSEHHANITVASQYTGKKSPALCAYTGDPNNNTAAITLTDNPNYQPYR